MDQVGQVLVAIMGGGVVATVPVIMTAIQKHRKGQLEREDTAINKWRDIATEKEEDADRAWTIVLVKFES